MNFKGLMVLTFGLLILLFSGPMLFASKALANEIEKSVTVYNPLGTPPKIHLKTMAPRLDTLVGKTIYVVDDGYIGGDNLLLEMIESLRVEYPETTFVFRRKGGFGFEAIDYNLWNEMNQRADAMIIGMGH